MAQIQHILHTTATCKQWLRSVANSTITVGPNTASADMNFSVEHKYTNIRPCNKQLG